MLCEGQKFSAHDQYVLIQAAKSLAPISEGVIIGRRDGESDDATSIGSTDRTDSDSLELPFTCPRLLPESRECTMIVRHLPVKFTQADLLKLWDPRECRFNYLLLPYSTKKRGSTNYCFINFASRKAALDFQAAWSGVVVAPKHAASHKKNESLEVSETTVQGFWENVLHFGTNHMDRLRPTFYPAIFDRAGKRLDFEETLRLAQESHANARLELVGDNLEP